MSKARFLQALQDVVANQVDNDGMPSWQVESLWMRCAAGGCDVWVNVSGQVTLCDDEKEVYLRPKDGNLVESVRFAENLRRLLAGKPSLEAERLQKALDQACGAYGISLPDVPIQNEWGDGESDEEFAHRLRECLPHGGDTVLFVGSDECWYFRNCPELAAELKRRAGEVQG